LAVILFSGLFFVLIYIKIRLSRAVFKWGYFGLFLWLKGNLKTATSQGIYIGSGAATAGIYIGANSGTQTISIGSGFGGDVTISSGSSISAGVAAGDLILQSGGGLGSSGAVTLKSLNTAGNSGSVTISTGTSAFTSGDINLTTQAGSSAANTGRVIITSPTNNASGALSLTAASTSNGTAMAISATALQTGTGLSITGPTSGSTFTTGKLLSATTASTGLTTAGTNTGTLLDLQASGASTAFTGSLASIAFGGNAAGNTGSLLNIASTGASSKVQSILVTNNSTVAPASGLVQFNFSGAHTNNGFQIDDVTTAGNAMQINANSLQGGSALFISATGLTAQATPTTDSGAAIKIDVGATANRRYMLFMNGATPVGSITPTGSSPTVAFNTTSDARLKENVVDTAYNLDTVLALQIHDYNFKSDPDQTKLTGFIAQELYKIFPDAVTPGNDAVDENGVLLNPWSVDYGKLTPLLAKGIQDLNTKVGDLQSGLSTSVLQSIASANAITINGTLTINGVTIFNGNTKFNGDITVNQDGAGEATIPAGDSSTNVTFSKELASIPMVTASPQDFIDGQYKITNVTKNGFTIRTSTNQTSDVKFSWTAVQK